MVLKHYKEIHLGISDCKAFVDELVVSNPMNYRKASIYEYKFKKMLCATALGMTPGAEWDGRDKATGGYIIIKRDGDVLCYHIYNRDYFEEYLLKNTKFDRPSASRYEFGYIYRGEDDNFYVDLNVQIRFKPIK